MSSRDGSAGFWVHSSAGFWVHSSDGFWVHSRAHSTNACYQVLHMGTGSTVWAHTAPSPAVRPGAVCYASSTHCLSLPHHFQSPTL